MQWLVRFATSTIGAKVIVAITGIGMIGFAIAHMLGHWQLFAGYDQYNAYAQGLKDLGPLLWVARLGLIGMIIAHVAMTLRLTGLSKAARAMPYKNKRPVASTAASRSMLYAGVFLLLFIVFHLFHYTFGLIQADHFNQFDPQGRHHVYNMTVQGLQSPVVAGFYILAMGSLAMHLKHGTSSMFQTLGLNHPKYRPIVQAAGPGLAALIFIGYSIVPLAVLFGILKPV